MAAEFENFTPESFLSSVEEALDARLTGFASALPSYINRVYELEAESGDRVVAKFYRPGRWTPDAILDEHDFLWDCDEDEIPVVAPYELSSGSTLGFTPDGVPFAVFPKKSGRESEFESKESFQRVGSLLGRIHACGARRTAENRMKLTPDSFAYAAMARLFDSGAVSKTVEAPLMEACNEVLDIADDLFPPESRFQRIHGDFHRANVLDRPGEGLMAIDFDDMLIGPAVQDLWLLLPDTVMNSEQELDWLLESYTVFRDFDRRTLKLVEPLRAMRMMHYLSWCAMQSSDRRFQELYPEWGTEAFWRRELEDFHIQLRVIHESLKRD